MGHPTARRQQRRGELDGPAHLEGGQRDAVAGLQTLGGVLDILLTDQPLAQQAGSGGVCARSASSLTRRLPSKSRATMTMSTSRTCPSEGGECSEHPGIDLDTGELDTGELDGAERQLLGGRGAHRASITGNDQVPSSTSARGRYRRTR